MSANETVAAEPQPVAPAGATSETSGIVAQTGTVTADTATAAATAAAASTTPTAPPAAAAATAATMDPSAAVNAAMMAERVIRRASLTAGGGGMMGMGLGNMHMNMGLLNAGGGMGLMNPADEMAMNQQQMLGDNSLFERAMALQSEQHQNTMALARASLGLDPNDPRASLGLGTLTPRGSLGLGTMGTRASLGLGTMGTRASLGLGTMGTRRASLGFGSMPARPSLGLGTMPGAPGAAAAAPGGSPGASNGISDGAGGGGQSDQQTLLRLAQIRTARAEVQAAQARLAELETHTALAASQAAMGQGGNSEDLLQVQAAATKAKGADAANRASAIDNAGGTEGEGDEQADARDLEAAETFLSMSGKKQQDQIASGDGAAASGGNAVAANADADAMMQPALGMAPGVMVPGMAALGNMNMLPAMQMGQMMSGFPRRVSMDLLAQNAGGLQQIPNAAFLAEAMMAERRLSNAAGAAANFAVTQERRSTLPMVNGTVVQPGMMQQINAGDNSSSNNYTVPSGVPVPTASQTGSASTKSSRTRPADAPRRPLSAYNFFFIDERERILKAMKKRDEKTAAEKEGGGEDGDESNKEEEGKDVKDGEKQEEDPLKDVDLDDSNFSPSTYDELMTLRLNNKEKPRPHRKTHGKIGFQTLAKLIASRWKALANDRRDHYKSLAAIDMNKYKEKTQEYQKKKMKNSEGEAIPTGESSV